MQTVNVRERPWFLSVTAPLSIADGSEELLTLLNVEDFIPAHQIAIRPTRWHFTVFCILKANGHPTESTAEDYTASLLHDLVAGQQTLIAQLNNAFEAVTVDVFEITCRDSGTTVQMRCSDGSLGRLRSALLPILKNPVEGLCREHNRAGWAVHWAE